MEEVTNEMLVGCLRFIQESGGEVSRYSFDRYVTKNIRIRESFNLVPRKLVEEGLIDINRIGKK